MILEHLPLRLLVVASKQGEFKLRNFWLTSRSAHLLQEEQARDKLLMAKLII